MSVKRKAKRDCCGCNACAEICPKRCITMTEDKKGFLYPRVDTETCIECGLCERVCPFPPKPEQKQRPSTAYAAWANDPDIHATSSSGGAAYVLSANMIKKGGVAYGCWADGLNVSHIRVDKINDLHRLQGSKYVQSNIRDVFSRVKHDLATGLDVLFTGTPCQVAGLKNYLGKDYDNLLLADLICHGVPSQKMLREHVATVAPGRNIDHISFRDGNSYLITLKGENEELYRVDFWEDTFRDKYFKGFMSGITYRPSCHNCPYACPDRISDITIGDFWGLKAETLPETAGRGISVLLPSTQKGQSAISEIAGCMTLIKRPAAEAIAGNSQLRHPVNRCLSARIFSILYPVMQFDCAVKAALIPIRLRSAAWRIKKMLLKH